MSVFFHGVAPDGKLKPSKPSQNPLYELLAHAWTWELLWWHP